MTKKRGCTVVVTTYSELLTNLVSADNGIVVAGPPVQVRSHDAASVQADPLPAWPGG